MTRQDLHGPTFRTRARIVVPALAVLAACGTAARDAGQGPNSPGSDGSVSIEGSVGVPGDGSLGDAASTIVDASDLDVSATAAPDVATMLQNSLPYGKCPASSGAVISVILDGKDLSGLPWVLAPGSAPLLVTSNGYAALNDDDVAFYVTIPYSGLRVGTWSAPAVRTMIQFGGQSTFTFTCSGLTVTGGVRITSIVETDASPSAQVCGAYDLDCTDAPSGHHLHVSGTFNDSVTVNSGIGGH